MGYIWQRNEWPNFTWDSASVDENAYMYAMAASSLVGQVSHLSNTDTLIDLMVSEAVTTSQIEGELFNRQDVRSSIRNQLGMNKTPEVVRNPGANGVASLMIAVRNQFKERLTAELLYKWHKLLISNPRDRKRLEIGKWRTTKEPMLIVSGSVGREKVHYEAPPSSMVPREMKKFIVWFNESKSMKGSVRAGVAHLYFECIHPFSDGNGRIGRSLSEIALSQELGHPALLSLSTTIAARGKNYYAALSKASRGTLDITEWLIWFTQLVHDAQFQAKVQIEFVLYKARFWDTHKEHLHERQTKVMQRLLDEGPSGFVGGLTARKYMKITHCSKATATRDLTDLHRKGCLKKLESGGRSTRYNVNVSEKGKA